jgi:hypothetical protein
MAHFLVTTSSRFIEPVLGLLAICEETDRRGDRVGRVDVAGHGGSDSGLKFLRSPDAISDA